MRSRVLLSISLVLLTILTFGSHLIAHQIPLESPPQSELARTQPPLQGSDRFLRSAPAYLRHLCKEEQHSKLDDIERRLAEASHIRWGADGVPQSVAEYQRWRAEGAVIELLTTLPEVLEIDAQNNGPTEESSEHVHVNRQSPCIFLKIHTGEGPIEFFEADWNLQREAHPEDFEVVAADRGTTYALLRLTGVPAGDTQERFSIRRRTDSRPFRWHGVKLTTSPWGNLAIAIEDEDGKPAPALIRLRSVADGSLWELPDAIDMRPQLNNVVNQDFISFEPGQGYTFFLPGTQRGRYWVAKPTSEIPIPAGEWEVRIQHGTEYLPVVDRVKVSPNQWTRKTYKLDRWVDMPSEGWWSGDDHVHARLMSKADADRLITYCKAVDLHVANVLQMGDVARTYYAQRGFGTEYRVGEDNFWLIPGQEDPRSVLGHAIGLNLQEEVRDLELYLQNDLLAARIHQQGGLYGHTHMGANACFVDREMALFTPMDIVDFNSIMQASLGTELYYEMLNLGFKMTASAGADTPYGGTIGAVRVYVHTGNTETLDPDAWFDALKAGRTFVTNGPMIDFTVEDRMPGDTIELSGERTLSVKVRAKGAPGGSSVKSLKVVQCGAVVGEEVSDDSSREEVSLEMTVDPDQGCWIAVQATGHDGSEAHTTPVYVTVNGSRHWDLKSVPKLIEKQLARLDDIESALQESENAVERNNDPLDYWNQLNAGQATAVRARLAKVRGVYAELLEQSEIQAAKN